MNVSTITMDPAAARTKLTAYQAQLRRRADDEYEAAAAGYQALAAGTPLINLADAFAQTGLGDDGRPRLAIARADRRQVRVRAERGFLVFSALADPRRSYRGSLIISVPYTLPDGVRPNDGYALVPLVPADVRPVTGAMRDLFILWEVKQWASAPFRAEADRDPYLLRHIAGDLYAVVAEWELTELERAITAGRRER